MTIQSRGLPNAFIWRRLHSFMGFWLVLFLIEHLLTNSQAALYIGDDGYGFINAVNAIHNLPYLEIIELFLIGVPLLIHMIWGVQYLFTGKLNSGKSDGTTPSLGEYPRNRAYSWQRITSWLLLIGILAHVIQMRFVDYPVHTGTGDDQEFMVRLNFDPGLYTLAERLNVQIFDQERILMEEADLAQAQKQVVEKQNSLDNFESDALTYNEELAKELEETQKIQQREEWISALKKQPLKNDQVIAASSKFGTATLLTVRDSFKSPTLVVLYTLLVLAAVYHAFNGFWTFMITWGISLTQRSQLLMRKLAVILMAAIAFLGLAAIWGTYWFNLRH